VHGPERVLERAEDAVGALRASVVAHAQSGVGGLLETDVAAWDRHLAVNVRGAFLLCAGFVRRWKATRARDASSSRRAGRRSPVRSRTRAKARSNGSP
jgi:NAD(P)-dependent dehydrogenase (short-subunit alcohol dehydrogenase family)